MELILALVLGIYWICRISVDKSKTKAARQEYDEISKSEKELRDKWFSAVTDYSIETELEDRLYRHDEALIQELKNTWNDYFYCSFPETIYHRNSHENKNYIFYFDDNYVSDANALRILMANRGLLCRLDAELGIGICEYGDTEAQRRVRYSKEIRFLQAIDRKLEEHGNIQEMYIHTGTYYYSFPTERVMYGIVNWRPMISIFALRLSETMKKEMEARK